MPQVKAKTNPSPVKKIADQLIAYAHESARKNGIAPQWLLNNAIDGYEEDPEHADAKLKTFIRETAKHKNDPAEFLKATQFLAADQITLNAVGNMYRAVITPNPRERFTDYFQKGLSGTQADKDLFIDALGDAQKKMIISIVQTMHPTIYHSKFAREQETKLTQKLEQIAEVVKKKSNNKLEPLPEGYPLLTDAKAIIDDMIKNIAEGKEVTPHKRVIVQDENELDRENHREMRRAFEGVVSDYNHALLHTIEALKGKNQLTPAQQEKLQASLLNGAKIVQWRTWAFGADADGRDKATSPVLYDGIHGHVRDKKFHGRRRDARENAKEHKNAISCLIQRAYRKSGDFRAFCNGYIAEQDTIATSTKPSEDRISWQDSGKSTLLQLRETEQVEFIRRLITSGYGPQGKFGQDAPESLRNMKLVPASLKAETIKFNEMFHTLYPEFLKENNLPAGTELESLDEAQRKKLAQKVAAKQVEAHGELIQFKLDEKDLVYSPQNGDNQDFFSPALKTAIKEAKIDGGKALQATNKKMPDKDRRKVLDVVKRLQVLDDAIDKYGPVVADRYQIANFEKASDFYAALLLFKEAGIVEIKDGKVVGKPKLSIQPLLETEKDQKNAIEMFGNLLKDPLVKSYYQALGNHADIMVGYSDGAKSAGNFASEWSIYKCVRNLKKVFADEGINVRVFHGRGRGDSRGGHFEEGQSQRLLPPEFQKEMVFDETIQSDGPMNGAISKSRGQDTMAGIILGTITARREAQELDQDPKRQQWLTTVEDAINSIAKTSSDKYCTLVKDNPHTLKLLEVVHDNEWKASRPSKRGASENLEDVRAIPVENGFNMVDSALHYTGLKSALSNFVKTNGAVTDPATGKQVTGNEALEALYESHPHFRALMDKTERGLVDFDPNVFRKYAKVAGDGVPEWAEECIHELMDTRKLVQDIRNKEFSKKTFRGEAKDIVGVVLKKQVESAQKAPYVQHERTYALGQEFEGLRRKNVDLDKMAHGVALAQAYENGEMQSIRTLRTIKGDDTFNPLRPDHEKYPQQAEAMENLSFVAMESNRNRGLFTPSSIRAGIDHVPMSLGR